MKLVTTTHALESRYGLKTAIRMLKEYGFDAYDCSLHTAMVPGKPFSFTAPLDYAKEVREYADKVGITCAQTHALFPSLANHEDIKNVIPSHVKAIEISAILGAEAIVIHPVCYTDEKEGFDLLYRELLPYAEKNNIKIATENMFTRDKVTKEIIPSACGTGKGFSRCIDYASSKYFTGCLDIGHANLKNSERPEDMIRTLGKARLGALHVHDNNGIDDQHTIPFNGTTDWDAVCRALAEIDYQGDFTFEVLADTEYPDKLLPSFYQLLHKTGRHLISKIEDFRKECAK